jgi:hypothetical protein
MGNMRNACKIFIREPERKKPLGRHRCGCEDNIRTDLREVGWEGVAWIRLAQDSISGGFV